MAKTTKSTAKRFTDNDLQRLKEAKLLLENPGLAARIANSMGAPIEFLIANKLSSAVSEGIKSAARNALEAALKVAKATIINKGEALEANNKMHKAAVVMTGGVGGFFGIVGLAVELPLTTIVMMRSIVEIARSEGEDLSDPSALFACLEVFALGGNSSKDDGSETGYFAVRALMAQQVASAAEHVVAHGFASKGAPAVFGLIGNIAARFSVTVTEKFVAQAVPVVGAVGGATLNALFLNHFQSAAKGHFIVRNLQRKYGQPAVRAEYDKL